MTSGVRRTRVKVPKLALCYDDVNLAPQYSKIASRQSDEIDISSDLGLINLSLPIVASPMDKVISPQMCYDLAVKGGLSIVHRFFETIEDQVEYYEKCIDGLECFRYLDYVGAAIGTRDWEERSLALYDAGCRIFCIDVAHGHHENVKKVIEGLKTTFPSDTHDKILIIAGSVATYEGYRDLVLWGAHVVRVGVGSGAACTTTVQTGHGIPAFQSVLDCAAAKADYGGLLMADGGIREFGDINKALAAGADMVMLGKMLAATSSSPSSIYTLGETEYKQYRGMFSREIQMEVRGTTRGVEGVSGLIEYTGRTCELLSEIELYIKSGMSYSGATTLEQYSKVAEWIRRTPSGRIDGGSRLTNG